MRWLPLLLLFTACSRPPDVVVVTWDTARADRVGPAAAVPGLTPRYDALAREGALFTQARSPTPITLPAHATVLTGQDVHEHGARTNAVFRLEADAGPTLAERLQGEGYATGAFVSAGVIGPADGLTRGFDAYDAEFAPVADGLTLPRRDGAETVERAIAWLGGLSARKPVFLWLHLYDPHGPLSPPDRLVQQHGNPYDAAIAYADEQTGRLFDALQQAGRWDRSLVVVTADHGESLGEHGEPGHGYFAYDSTLRIPMVWWAGADSGVPVSTTRTDARIDLADVAPTVLDLLGLPTIGTGRSLRPLLGGQPLPPQELPFECVESAYAYGAAPTFGVVDAEGRSWFDLPKPELYDLDADPGQLANLYGPEHADAAAAVFARHPRAWPQASRTVEDERVEQLVALGYLGAGGGRLEEDAPDPKDLIEAAAMTMGHGRGGPPEQVIARYAELRSQLGTVPRLAIHEAVTLEQWRGFAPALAVLDAAVADFPGHPALEEERDRLVRMDAEQQQTEGMIRQALKAAPDHPDARYDLARTLHRRGKRAQAEAAFRDAIEFAPQDPGPRLGLAHLLSSWGEVDAALVLLDEAPTDLRCARAALAVPRGLAPESAMEGCPGAE